jgi:putative ABC transport system permease protein
VLQDIRHALRVFRRTPGVTAAALAALALGIGANTAIFSLMEAVLLRPLPYPQPDRLMSLAATDRRGAMNTSWPVFQDWQEQSRLFERMAAYAGGSANLTGAGEPERVGVVRVTPDMFAVIGASPWVGGLDGGVHTAVLSHGFWMRRFGGDRRSVGQALLLDGAPYTVSGVLPPGFRFPKWSMMDEPDVYVSLAPNPDRRFHFLRVIGRLKAGVAVAQAQTEMDQVSAAIGRAFPRANPGEGARVSPLQQDLTFGTGRTLGAFMAAVVLVLLIACANVSNLLLSQAVRRQREMAIRNALGAGRMRLIRQFLVESMALSLAGGALGVVLALWGIPLLEAAIPAHSAFSTKVAMGGAGIDLPVLGFAMAVSVASAVLFGVLPAWQASRSETSVRLRSRSTSGERARGVLIAVEVGLSLVLLAGAGLLLKSFVRLLSVDPGFRTRQLLTVDIELPEYRYGTAEKRAAFVRDVLARLGSVPGVASAAAVNAMPLSKVSARSSFRIAGSMQDLGPVDFRAVTPAYFAAMGIPVIRGATGECLVNQSMARVYWPNDDLVGKTIELQRGAVRLQFPITGIVGDVRHRGLDVEPRPELYVPFLAMPTDSFTLVLYSAGDRATLARAARQEIRAVDPDQPLAAVRTIEQLVGAEVAGWRFVLLLLAVFAAVAVTLASAGIFAVVAHSVAQRRREIGIRVALGAGSGEVVRTVVSSTLLWVAAGMAAGTAGALAAGRLLAGYLYDVQPRDPAALGIAALSLAAVAVVAAWIPARNAARVDPAITLRSE